MQVDPESARRGTHRSKPKARELHAQRARKLVEQRDAEVDKIKAKNEEDAKAAADSVKRAEAALASAAEKKHLAEQAIRDKMAAAAVSKEKKRLAKIEAAKRAEETAKRAAKREENAAKRAAEKEANDAKKAKEAAELKDLKDKAAAITERLKQCNFHVRQWNKDRFNHLNKSLAKNKFNDAAVIRESMGQCHWVDSDGTFRSKFCRLSARVQLKLAMTVSVFLELMYKQSPLTADSVGLPIDPFADDEDWAKGVIESNTSNKKRNAQAQLTPETVENTDDEAEEAGGAPSTSPCRVVCCGTGRCLF